MTKRVLVTRPEPGASRTARRLEALGHEAVVLPLTEIRPLPVQSPLTLSPQAGRGGVTVGEFAAPAKLLASPRLRGEVPGRAERGSARPQAGFDLVAMTSANAVRYAPETLLAQIRHLHCFAVGEETAATARQAGFATVHVGAGDAAALAEIIAANAPLDARVLYLCGRVRRPDFEAVTESAGRPVVAVETYDTVETPPSPARLREVFSGPRLDAVMLHSAGSAAVLARLRRRRDAKPALAGTVFVCISRRVAGALDGAPGRVLVAATPDENAMLALLAEV